ncbi:DUF2076 domain-containing protein [Hafnia alvei]|uniref:Periplasmic ligand-binding sensor protein n=1 Tax=Hafnia alvei ATCC 51873 TaxID=1002364 RepID=G9Y9S6_HAFAL|nr:DUF2076 domain-containing protein [Hafnia alvei]EHM40507.1 hypothetical protein HMPREF0454_03345 [Hafnia alvei ATCC 51873]QQE43617.1 DUF2076 domain-containing protein [Hafnia alvei]
MSEQQSVEQRVISDLFSRIQQAEAGSGPRDAEAERLIQECIAKQPAAPYYMAQAMLVQEAAIKRLNEQVNALQQQVTQLQSQPRQSSGGFLAGLFGGGSETRPTSASNSGSQPIPGAANYANNGYANNSYAAAPSRSGSFLSGALQTAAGVAGGVVIADMLTGMFRNSQPEEIVNVVEDNNIVQPDSAQPDLTKADNAQPDNAQPDLQNADWQDDTSNQNGQDSGFFDSGFGSDDDSYNNNDDDSFF